MVDHLSKNLRFFVSDSTVIYIYSIGTQNEFQNQKFRTIGTDGLLQKWTESMYIISVSPTNHGVAASTTTLTRYLYHLDSKRLFALLPALYPQLHSL